MKATMIKKFNIIVSLWLIAIIAVLVVLGFKLNVFGFYIAAMVVGSFLLASNTFNIVSGLVSSRPRAVETERKYN